MVIFRYGKLVSIKLMNQIHLSRTITLIRYRIDYLLVYNKINQNKTIRTIYR